jgi:hypothetical protein
MTKTWLDVLNIENKVPIPQIITYIETAAKEQLSFLHVGERFTTTELADAMWDPKDVFPDSPGIDPFTVRKRLFTFLGHIDHKTQRPTLLPQWRERGNERMLHGKKIRPWLWFNPLAKGD